MTTTTENTVFIIYNTQGTPIAAIQPNTLNGPDGVQTSSDLSLFGIGYPTWGQASDQNDYRLLEHFACPQSTLNPTPIQPMGSTELGNANGISTPIIGMLWFNTTNSTMYVYDGTTWDTVASQISSGGTAPSSPFVGELWYNTTIPQLEVYSGSVNGFQSVAQLYLPLTGGTMMGDINMNNNNIIAADSLTATSVNSTYFRANNAVTGNQITIPIDGSATLLDGPRIGNYVIYHTGNLPSSSAPYVVGMVIMWAGILSTIGTGAMAGWALCNGTTVHGFTTPNMTGMIPIGINSGTVGSKTLTLTTTAVSAGTPTGTVTISTANMPIHAHATEFYTGAGINRAGPPGTTSGTAYWFGGAGAGVAQTVTSGSVGSGTAASLTVSALPTHTHQVVHPTVGLFFICYVGT
jgi:hypothetical protein